MRCQRSLCIFLLIAAAKNVLSNPVHALPSTPPVDVLDDKAAVPVLPTNIAGEKFYCEHDSDCTTSELGPSSHCAGQHCQCNIGSSQSPDSRKCLAEAPSLGSGCEETWQCTRTLGKKVECKDYQCTCTSDAAVVDGKCWKQIPLSGTCDDNNECMGGEDTVCSDNVCQCTLKKVPHSNNDRCLDVAKDYGDTCEEDIQCTEVFGDGGLCQDGKCHCQSGFHFKNQACVKNLILDDVCEHVDGECFLEASFGLDRVKCDKTCVCKDEFHPSEDKKSCLVKGQPDPGTGGGAASIAPVFATILSLLLAKLVAS